MRTGFYGDFVFNRLLKTDVNPTFQGMSAKIAAGATAATNTTDAVNRENVALHKNMTQSELYTNAGIISLNIWDRFDIFTTLGTTNAYIKANSNAFNLIGFMSKATTAPVITDRPNVSIGNSYVELYTDAEFSWSIGARGVLWECGCATLGAEFQYAQAKPEISDINVVSNVAQFYTSHPKGFFFPKDNQLPIPMTGTDQAASGNLHIVYDTAKPVSLNYSEWQVGLALSYRLNMLSPYVGIKWARAKFDFDQAFIAQPQLEKEILDMYTWNPTLAGGAAAATDQDVLSKVSITLNKLKSRKLLICKLFRILSIYLESFTIETFTQSYQLAHRFLWGFRLQSPPKNRCQPYFRRYV